MIKIRQNKPNHVDCRTGLKQLYNNLLLYSLLMVNLLLKINNDKFIIKSTSKFR